MRSRALFWTLVLLAGVLAVQGLAFSRVANGFDLSDSLVPVREIRGGGPPRDGIPALDDPPRETVDSASRWLAVQDRVMGVAIGGEAVAYPIRILNWHEIVNDVVGKTPIVVTYCPLCASGVVFDARVGGRRAFFGVSGLLYNSDVLMFDRRTESLFSQLMFKAITGPLRGTELETVPARSTTWKEWKELHPSTEVLSRALPYSRDYGIDPYSRYHRSGNTMFPIRGADSSRPGKSWAYLIMSEEITLLVPDDLLRDAAEDGARRHEVDPGLLLQYDPGARDLRVLDASGREATVIPGYWFALSSFHEDARVLDHSDLRPAEK